MYQDGWRPDAIVNGSEEELLKHVEMNWRKVAVIVLFVLQYLIIAIYPLMGGDSNLTFDFMLAVMIITMIVVGIIGVCLLKSWLMLLQKALALWLL